jgi:cytochrome c oxidase subunit 2
MKRRQFARLLGLGVCAAGLWPWRARSQASSVAKAGTEAKPREIEVIAQRFKYTPSVLRVAEGETVVLLAKSLDFVDGMNFPAHGVRADLLPGLITRVTLPPKPAGRYDFVCDNFCGDGHEEMHGQVLVGG